MKAIFPSATWTRWVVAVLALLLLSGTSALAAEKKLEAQLIWGTNDDSSPDPSHKPVDKPLEKRLKRLPFKWRNYFIVTTKPFTAEDGKAAKVVLSKDCEIEVRTSGQDTVELSLVGKGTQVSKIKQSLSPGEVLVTGGNAENLTAWFVVLRHQN